MQASLGKRRVQHRFRHRRQLKLVLLCLGLAGTVLGLMLIGAAIFRSWKGLLRLGTLYLVASMGILGIRMALNLWDDMCKRKYSRPIDLRPATHALRPAPAPVIENPEEQEHEQEHEQGHDGAEAAPGGPR